jgi:hypothetical protein
MAIGILLAPSTILYLSSGPNSSIGQVTGLGYVSDHTMAIECVGLSFALTMTCK